MRKFLWFLLLWLGASLPAWAVNGRESLNHYGLAILDDAQVNKELGSRFKGSGKPVFLVHDLKLGVSAGDVIRFSDKAVLVDAAVLQTLKAVGALAKIHQASVLRLQARAGSTIWKGRSSLVSNGRERKGYGLGAELLKIFEDYFGGVPSSDELVIRFEGRDMVLMVPDAMLDRLTFTPVRKIPTAGKPVLVSSWDRPRRFLGDTLFWPLWGADPSEPEAVLQYGVAGDLPPGLQWQNESHAIAGRPDSIGNYSFVVWVRNPSGASDSMNVFLEVRKNQAPQFAPMPLPVARAGSTWHFAPVYYDNDHAVEELRCFADSLPPGVGLDSTGCALDWDVPGDAQNDDMPAIPMQVCDPLGACTLDTLHPRLAGPVVSRLSAIRFVLPEDTLVQGQRRLWPISQLLAPGIQLLDVAGVDECGIDSAEKMTRLWIKPVQSGEQTIAWLLKDGSDTVWIKQRLMVLPNRPPQFLSTLSNYIVEEGQRLAYRPVAVDPDNDSLSWRLKTADNRFIRYSGNEMVLWTSSPGYFTLEFIVSDSVNPPVRQRIAYEVREKRAEWKGVVMRHKEMGPVDSWWLYGQIGSARVGLFTPKLNEVFRDDVPARKEWPYFFAGGSFLGDRAMTSGSWLWVDMGFQVRKPSDQIWSGGVMGNIEGRYASKDKRHPWVFEGELSVHANQAILVVDTSGWANRDYQVLFDTSNGNFNIEDLNQDSIFHTYLGPAADKLLDDITARDNVVVSLRLESWIPLLALPYVGDFSAGPAYWREEYVLHQESHQLLGGGLRHSWSYRKLGLVHSLRMGYDPARDANRFWYDLLISFGRWD